MLRKKLVSVRLQNFHKWIALIASFLLGGPFSAVAAFFIWRTPWNKKTKVVSTIIATLIINILSLGLIALLPKILLWELKR